MTSATGTLYQPIPQNPQTPSILELSPEELTERDDLLDDASGTPAHHRGDLPVSNFVRWIHFILGAAVLLPWNALITATPYFLSRLAGSSLRSAFSSYLTTTFTAANFAFLAHATATSKQTDHSRRIFLSTTWLVLLVALLALSTYFKLPPGLFFAFIILNGIVQASAGSYLQTAVVAIASMFGPEAMQSAMSGQAAVGVLVSGIQVLSATASIYQARPASDVFALANEDGEAEATAAFVFFSVSTLFLIFTIYAYTRIIRMPTYKEVVVPYQRRRSLSLSRSIDSLPPGLFSEKSRIMRIFKKNILYETTVAYGFIVTLSLFPPVTSSVHSVNPSTHPLLFNSIHFLLFNVGDLAGRYLCALPQLVIWDSRKLLCLAMLRTLFIPLFLLCNVQRPSDLPLSTPFFNSDVIFFVLMLLFGCTNGYLCSLGMMAAASLDHNPQLEGRREDVDVAATIASFCLVGGLVTGSALSFAVRAIICECNPFVE